MGERRGLVGSDKGFTLVSQDFVKHFEDRVAALDDKAMVLCEPAHLRGALRRHREAASAPRRGAPSSTLSRNMTANSS
jgi:hypothetical protein